ncbi:MAG: tRNA uridine(34) 5-carboxymethylaminomethyl modification radical SAM/GNAT enzyme Elp3 [Candidatus Woesearchaeota archaeon]
MVGIKTYNSKKLNDEFLEEITLFLYSSPSKLELAKKKVELCRKHGLKKIPTDIEIYLNLKVVLPQLKKILQTKPVRTASGVASVALMTFPFCCPHGKCTYCPGGKDSFFGDVPQSYTGNEPATMRGVRSNYDPYIQVFNRLEQYIAIGQSPEKIELIIMGGTFIATNKEYRDEFVRLAFCAMNDFSDLFYVPEFDFEKFKDFFELPGSLQDVNRVKRIHKRILQLKDNCVGSLKSAHAKNELSRIKCVGLTIETKPDQGFLKQGNDMLELGCTRVELGVQTLKDDILLKVKRGHNMDDTRRSIRELRNLGFKLNFHMMPGLPGTSIVEDKNMFHELFELDDYRPDMLKIYPLMVMPGTELYEDFKQGLYSPLKTDDAIGLLVDVIPKIPRYCRVMRVQRDIPPKFAKAGVDRSNLRQLIDFEIEKRGFVVEEIRHREIKGGVIVDPVSLDFFEYSASGGVEFFISLNDAGDSLLGFVRLRFPSQHLRSEISVGSALIRELHVYGAASPINESDSNAQHKGFGRRLMQKAEEIAKNRGFNKMVVISGVGVREYYKKLGYVLEGPYMIKFL